MIEFIGFAGIIACLVYLDMRRAKRSTEPAPKPITVHDSLSVKELEELDFLADMEDFREETQDPEYLAAFHHWVQIHSDANVDEERVARLRDEWGKEAA